LSVTLLAGTIRLQRKEEIMAKHRKPSDDLQTVAPTGVADIPGEPAGNRLDYGDAARRADMDEMAETAEIVGLDELFTDEPIGVVDAPAQPREPFTRADKRRNLRG
jgi:hypothetical protein